MRKDMKVTGLHKEEAQDRRTRRINHDVSTPNRKRSKKNTNKLEVIVQDSSHYVAVPTFRKMFPVYIDRLLTINKPNQTRRLWTSLFYVNDLK